ncbi:MAG: hypothetical protein BRC33_12425 [Cyanobacteria bacterium SW_9_44_58]|nr:MAG: hypothetical protein BRC33_12425 [Cyanobacteria bacterium SW_9_44_58]
MKDINVTINNQTYYGSYEINDNVMTVYFEYGNNSKSESIGSAKEAALAKVLLTEMVMDLLTN